MSHNYRLKDVLDAQLSTLTWSEAESRAMMSRLKGEKTRMKKRASLALALAATFLLAGAALAAGLGAFGVFGNETNRERLERLDTIAQTYGTTVKTAAPQGSTAPIARTLREEIEAYQDEYNFSLTLDQAYCDGKKLYYAYTLRTNRTRGHIFAEGRPDGFDRWEVEEPGKKVCEIWSYTDEEQNRAFREWFGTHEEGYAVVDNVSLGDGCRLTDGRVCNIYDDGAAWIDDTTLRGFQEVTLPEDAVRDGEVAFVLSIHYGTTVTYQNEDGAYWARVAQRENNGVLRVPMTVRANGEADTLTSVHLGEGYTERAELIVSDVEIFGTVTIAADDARLQKAPDAFWPDALPVSYELVTVDGQTLPNLGGALEWIDAHTVRVSVRYDLPKTMEGLALHPVYANGTEPADGAPDIELTGTP